MGEVHVVRQWLASMFVACLALSSLGCAPGEQQSPSARNMSAPLDTAESADACGPDVIRLLGARDSATVALHDTSERDFGLRWLERVQCLAERGDPEAQLKLGIAYRDGSDGPPQDYSQAAVWFGRAADQADPMAQYNLAQLYQSGRGVQQDIVRAYMWYSLAASGFEPSADTRYVAFQRRNELESRMTPGQLREAQQMASEWWSARNR
jgi:TPR repeat protein